MSDGHLQIGREESAYGDAAASARGRESYASRWGKRGALAGCVIAGFNVLASGAAEWHAAAVAGLLLAAVLTAAPIGFVAGTIADGTRLDATAGPDAPTPQKRRWNVLARFWRGEVRLWVSFWIIGVLAAIAAVLVPPLMVTLFDIENARQPLPIFLASVLTWSCVAALWVWESVGLWRSAGRHMRQRVRAGRRPFWGIVVQVWVVAGVVSNIATVFGEAGPQLIENYRVALQNDPDTDDYSFRVMRNGTEAMISGGFKFGLTDDFTRVLETAHGIKVVHLESTGGRMREAKRLYDLIKQRGLSTYVPSRCNSACTVAFAAGRERYLKQGAFLGFHRSSFPGIDETTSDGITEPVYREAGFGEHFISRVLDTPHSDLWRPEPDVLLKWKVISKVVDGSEFAVSGDEPFRRRLSDELTQAMPLLRTLRDKFPDRYDALVDGYHAALNQDRSRDEAWTALRTELMSFLTSLAARADDEVVVEYGRLTIAQYAALSARNEDACHIFSTRSHAEIFSGEFSGALNAREAALHHATIRTAREREKPDEAETGQLWDKVWERLHARGIAEADFDPGDGTQVSAERRARECIIVIALFEEVVALPTREAAVLMRVLLAR